jgi:hypothetical protein
MLFVSSNMPYRDNTLADQALAQLQRRLPAGWKVEPCSKPGGTDDACVEVAAPDQRRCRVRVQPRRRLDPRAVLLLAAQAAPSRAAEPLLVASSYLTPGVRARLREAGIAYADLTGNTRLELRDPGLFIETTGANENPEPEERPARSLKGPKAGRVVRALCDLREPGGVRELAGRAGVDPGYLSRLLALLDREALVERGARGRVARVDWARLLRRWADEAPFASRSRVGTFIEPRGLEALIAKLRTSGIRHSVTGSLAASRLAPIAAPRLAVIYVENNDSAAERLTLRPAEAGANVQLAMPADAIVFERAREQDGVTWAAPSQVVADLLGGPGRSPTEAEELLQWMAAHEEAWRG